MARLKAWLAEWSSTIAIIAIVLIFLFLGLNQASQNQKFREQAATSHFLACQAVRGSNNALEAFVAKEFGPRPSRHNAQVEVDLHDALLTAEIKCLLGGD